MTVFSIGLNLLHIRQTDKHENGKKVNLWNFYWKCIQKHCVRVSDEKIYMLRNFINQGHQPTMIILGDTVRDIIICNFGVFYSRVVEDSGL